LLYYYKDGGGREGIERWVYRWWGEAFPPIASPNASPKQSMLDSLM